MSPFVTQLDSTVKAQSSDTLAGRVAQAGPNIDPKRPARRENVSAVCGGLSQKKLSRPTNSWQVGDRNVYQCDHVMAYWHLLRLTQVYLQMFDEKPKIRHDFRGLVAC
jgi:hypothetical protein